MCAPEHISLVICVSRVGKHKTLKLCIQAVTPELHCVIFVQGFVCQHSMAVGECDVVRIP